MKILIFDEVIARINIGQFKAGHKYQVTRQTIDFINQNKHNFYVL